MRQDDWHDPRKVNAGGGGSRKVWRGAPDKAASKLNSREVIVRVTGRTASAAALGTHLSYLTRKGELPALLSTGRVLQGKDDMAALRDRWVTDNKIYARHGRSSTQSLCVVLSMPVGTPLGAVVASVHAWAAEHLAPKTEYLIAPHNDRAHPHCHVAVRSVQRDGTRLRASPAEVQAWRESFAESLRGHGLKVEATPRHEKLQRRLDRPSPPRLGL